MSVRRYNYHPYISNWMRKVEQKQIPSCNEQKLLMPFIRKVLDDPNTEFRKEHIEKAVAMLERHFPFKMHDYQLFRFAIFYGLYEKGTDFPIFNENFNMWGRGTGKNGTASMDSFYLASELNGIRKYDVNFVATSEDQAKTSPDEIRDILESNPSLYKKLFYWNKVDINYKKTNSTIKYLTANAKTKDGGRPGAVIFDEVHQYENYDIINVLTGGLGKVEKPRIIYLTTDGYIRDSVIDDLKEKSIRVLKGEEDHNGFFPFIFKMDNIQEFGKPELFTKAIPRLEYDKTLKRQVRKEYNNALYNDDLKEAFILKRLDLAYQSKTKTVTSWENLLRATEQKIPDLEGCECIGSVDFAEIDDFCSVGLTFKKNGKHIFLQHTFVHEESLKTKKYEKIDLGLLEKEGLVTIVRGYPVIPPDLIAAWFYKQSNKYYIKKVYSDRFKYITLKESFEKVGLELVGVPNGTISHNQLAPIITTMFANGDIILDGGKLMRWFFWNVKVETDKKGNKSYAKIEPIKRKTDGFFAFLHGMIATELNNELEESQIGLMDIDVITL